MTNTNGLPEAEQELVNKLDKESTETKNKTSIIYKIISYISLIYICYLPIRALTLNTTIVIYNIPILLTAIISIYFLTKKKQSYDLTIQLKKAVCWVVVAMMAASVICLDIVREQYIFSYSFINFWKNIFIVDAYNNLFFFSYNIIVLFVLGLLLTFNNIENVIEYYRQQEIIGHTSFYTNFVMILFMFIISLTFFKELYQITNNYFYFFGITYSSFFVGIFISRIVIDFLITIISFLKGVSHE